MLGAMLDAACARPLEAIVRAVVTQPLDLDNIAFVETPERVLATPYVSTAAFSERMSTRYYGPERDLLCADRSWQADACPPGDTGLIGAAAEYLRFLDALRGVGAPGSGLGWRFG